MSYYQGGGAGQPSLPSRLYPPLAQPVRSVTNQDGGPGAGGGFYPQIAQPVGLQPVRAPASPPIIPGGNGEIRVRIKSEYRMAPSVELSPMDGDIPRSTFHFDFALERQVLADDGDGDKVLPSEPTSDHVAKYVEKGLPREVVMHALSVFRDDENKVTEFCENFAKISEMGFPPDSITSALSMFDNDLRRALAHLIHGSGS